MATYGSAVRRGLPRVSGGEPWPPASFVPGGVVAPAADPPAPDSQVAPLAAADTPAQVTQVADTTPATPQVATPEQTADAAHTAAPAAPAAPAAAPAPAPTAGPVAVRRGLPRVPGGEPWPPASFVPTGARVAQEAASGAPTPQDAAPEHAPVEAQVAQVAAAAPATAQNATPERAAAGGTPLRRGLPRVPGGEPWPPAGMAPAASAPAAPAPAPAAPAPASTTAAPAAPARRTGLPRPTATPAATPAAAPAAQAATPAASTAVTEVAPAREPLPFPQTVFPTAGAAAWNRERIARQGKGPVSAPEPVRHGPFTTLQWVGAVIVGGAGLLFAAGMVVLAVRWFVSLDFMRDFLATYPGEYHLPETAPVGIPTWIGWQHFFNVFLMVLIIRTGLQVRHVKRPTAFWTPRNKPKGKISLSLWFHQSLDILWLVNGVIFVVLLFVTGQWMRIVPTSWEVFPNALSAGLQYVSLDWPTENGWVNYNSLQQLAYFATVFLAAPLAAITGVRMSGIWPKNAKGLNKAYPVEWARAVHFPVMLYFCLFILAHVTLVFATGALRNLNHMYGGQDAVNWTGFWIFVASMVVIVAAWVAARPLVLAPIARLFGNVSGR